MITSVPILYHRYRAGAIQSRGWARMGRPRRGRCAARALLTLCVLSIALAACGRTHPVVGVVPKGSHHLFWQTVHAGAAKAGLEFGLEIEWQAPESEANLERQVDIVSSMINRRLSGIALAPIDKKALVPVVKRAAARGIPVAIFDSGLESEDFVSYVATDNAGAGRLAARRMGKVLNGNGTVAIVSFMPGSAATIEREQAFQDELRLLFPAIRVVAFQYGMADWSKAELATESILEAHPKLLGIFADNESSSIGAMRALKKRGAQQVKLVAFDCSDELVAALKAGHVDSLVVQDPFRMGYETVRGLAQKLAGRQPRTFVDSGVRLVVAEDLESPDVRELLFPKLDSYLKSAKR